MEALPGQKNWLQKIGDGVKNLAHVVAMRLTPGAEVLNLETKLYISRRSISGYSKFTKKNLIF